MNRDANRKTILGLLRQSNSLTAPQIAQMTKLEPQLVRYHLAILRDCGQAEVIGRVPANGQGGYMANTWSATEAANAD